MIGEINKYELKPPPSELYYFDDVYPEDIIPFKEQTFRDKDNPSIIYIATWIHTAGAFRPLTGVTGWRFGKDIQILRRKKY